MAYHISNSLSQGASQTPKKQAQTAAKGNVSIKKKNFFQQMVDDLVVTDSKTVMQTVKDKVVIPGIKKLILDMVWAGITTTLYRTNPNSAPSPSFNQPSFNSSSRAYWTSSQQQTVTVSPSVQSSSFPVLYYDDSGDARGVLNEMQDLLEANGHVTVSEMYKMSLTPERMNEMNFHIDPVWDRWGWISLNGADVVPVRDGKYVLSLPKPMWNYN